MFNSTKFASVMVLLALAAVLMLAPVAQAQDTSTPVVCDSTLVTLLLVAEHDYDYLSSLEMSGGALPNVDLGQFQPLVHDIMAMMMDMQGQMTEEQEMMMATQEAMMAPMMGMSDEELMSSYMQSMNMEGDMSSMTMLAPGNVANEDPACAALRADVQHFLLVHILGEMMSGSM